ncbi:hypothetical protein [Streptomyces sp. SID2888]|uniref:hypothetical protein n=1 Tax=Streptomyces sp. SID2888 TaxID=2690256 RepID=UPI001F1F3F75|nr:hypothetical protein [Streptomyces sp. SID2888]
MEEQLVTDPERTGQLVAQQLVAGPAGGPAQDLCQQHSVGPGVVAERASGLPLRPLPGDPVGHGRQVEQPLRGTSAGS